MFIGRTLFRVFEVIIGRRVYSRARENGSGSPFNRFRYLIDSALHYVDVARDIAREAGRGRGFGYRNAILIPLVIPCQDGKEEEAKDNESEEGEGFHVICKETTI